MTTPALPSEGTGSYVPCAYEPGAYCAYCGREQFYYGGLREQRTHEGLAFCNEDCRASHDLGCQLRLLLARHWHDQEMQRDNPELDECDNGYGHTNEQRRLRRWYADEMVAAIDKFRRP